MSNIINDLLKYSRVGRNESDFEMVDMNEVIDLVRFNLADAIQESEAQVCCQELPRLCTNKLSIIQLFQNLIGNAIKFRRKT